MAEPQGSAFFLRGTGAAVPPGNGRRSPKQKALPPGSGHGSDADSRCAIMGNAPALSGPAVGQGASETAEAPLAQPIPSMCSICGTCAIVEMSVQLLVTSTAAKITRAASSHFQFGRVGSGPESGACDILSTSKKFTRLQAMVSSGPCKCTNSRRKQVPVVADSLPGGLRELAI